MGFERVFELLVCGRHLAYRDTRQELEAMQKYFESRPELVTRLRQHLLGTDKIHPATKDTPETTERIAFDGDLVFEVVEHDAAMPCKPGKPDPDAPPPELLF